MNIMWRMSANAAMEFYRRKAALGATTEEECSAVLLEMAKEGWIDSITETGRSKKQIVEDLSKNWNTLDLTDKSDEIDNSKD